MTRGGPDPQRGGDRRRLAGEFGTTAVVSLLLVLPVALGHGSPLYTHEAQLMASDGAPHDRLGTSVALDGDTALVGSGDTALDPPSGDVYAYTRQAPNVWTEQAELAPVTVNPTQYYGIALALEGDTALVGDPEADPHSQGATGAVYVFHRPAPGTWSHQATLTADDAQPGDGFGWAVALEDDTVLVGAVGDDNANGDLAGSLYTFTLDETGDWSQQAKVLAPAGEPGDNYGATIALHEATALVDNGLTPAWTASRTHVYTQAASGNWTHQQTLGTGGGDRGHEATNLALEDDTALIGSPGGHRVHVYAENRGDWSQQATLQAQEGFFGWSTSLEDERALVGSAPDRPPGVVSNDPGSATVFAREAPGSWTHQQTLEALDPVPGSTFGWSVALEDGAAVVGEPGDTNPNGEDAGGAWVFSTPPQRPLGDGSR